MEIDRKELKRQARERMTLTDPKFWVVALAYIAMTTGVSWLISLIPLPTNEATTLFFNLLFSLYSAVIQFGLCLWALWTYRQLDPGINSLTQGFSVAGRVILMKLGIFVRIMGWYFLAALVLFIPMVAILMVISNYVVGMTALLLFCVGLYVLLTAIGLRYALAPYLLADRPDDGPSAPIYRSVNLMRGWKWELFKLEFSFIGYEIINFVLSAAVMFFFLGQAGLLSSAALADPEWRNQALTLLYSTPVVMLSSLVTVPVSLLLLPYRAVARAGFYDARVLASEQESQLPEMPPL